jgi:hypothetical protein
MSKTTKPKQTSPSSSPQCSPSLSPQRGGITARQDGGGAAGSSEHQGDINALPPPLSLSLTQVDEESPTAGAGDDDDEDDDGFRLTEAEVRSLEQELAVVDERITRDREEGVGDDMDGAMESEEMFGVEGPSTADQGSHVRSGRRLWVAVRLTLHESEAVLRGNRKSGSSRSNLAAALNSLTGDEEKAASEHPLVRACIDGSSQMLLRFDNQWQFSIHCRRFSVFDSADPSSPSPDFCIAGPLASSRSGGGRDGGVNGRARSSTITALFSDPSDPAGNGRSRSGGDEYPRFPPALSSSPFMADASRLAKWVMRLDVRSGRLEGEGDGGSGGAATVEGSRGGMFDGGEEAGDGTAEDAIVSAVVCVNLHLAPFSLVLNERLLVAVAGLLTVENGVEQPGIERARRMNDGGVKAAVRGGLIQASRRKRAPLGLTFCARSSLLTIMPCFLHGGSNGNSNSSSPSNSSSGSGSCDSAGLALEAGRVLITHTNRITNRTRAPPSSADDNVDLDDWGVSFEAVQLVLLLPHAEDGDSGGGEEEADVLYEVGEEVEKVEELLESVNSAIAAYSVYVQANAGQQVAHVEPLPLLRRTHLEVQASVETSAAGAADANASGASEKGGREEESDGAGGATDEEADSRSVYDEMESTEECGYEEGTDDDDGRDRDVGGDGCADETTALDPLRYPPLEPLATVRGNPLHLHKRLRVHVELGVLSCTVCARSMDNVQRLVQHWTALGAVVGLWAPVENPEVGTLELLLAPFDRFSCDAQMGGVRLAVQGAGGSTRGSTDRENLQPLYSSLIVNLDGGDAGWDWVRTVQDDCAEIVEQTVADDAADGEGGDDGEENEEERDEEKWSLLAAHLSLHQASVGMRGRTKSIVSKTHTLLQLSHSHLTAANLFGGAETAAEDVGNGFELRYARYAYGTLDDSSAVKTAAAGVESGPYVPLTASSGLRFVGGRVRAVVLAPLWQSAIDTVLGIMPAKEAPPEASLFDDPPSLFDDPSEGVQGCSEGVQGYSEGVQGCIDALADAQESDPLRRRSLTLVESTTKESTTKGPKHKHSGVSEAGAISGSIGQRCTVGCQLDRLVLVFPLQDDDSDDGDAGGDEYGTIADSNAVQILAGSLRAVTSYAAIALPTVTTTPSAQDETDVVQMLRAKISLSMLSLRTPGAVDVDHRHDDSAHDSADPSAQEKGQGLNEGGRKVLTWRSATTNHPTPPVAPVPLQISLWVPMQRLDRVSGSAGQRAEPAVSDSGVSADDGPTTAPAPVDGLADDVGCCRVSAKVRIPLLEARLDELQWAQLTRAYQLGMTSGSAGDASDNCAGEQAVDDGQEGGAREHKHALRETLLQMAATKAAKVKSRLKTRMTSPRAADEDANDADDDAADGAVDDASGASEKVAADVGWAAEGMKLRCFVGGASITLLHAGHDSSSNGSAETGRDKTSGTTPATTRMTHRQPLIRCAMHSLCASYDHAVDGTRQAAAAMGAVWVTDVRLGGRKQTESGVHRHLLKPRYEHERSGKGSGDGEKVAASASPGATDGPPAGRQPEPHYMWTPVSGEQMRCSHDRMSLPPMGNLLDADRMISSPFIQELRRVLEEGTGAAAAAQKTSARSPLLQLVYTTQMTLISDQSQQPDLTGGVSGSSDNAGAKSADVDSTKGAASSLGVTVSQLQGYSQFACLAETMGVFGALGGNEADENGGGRGAGRWGRRAAIQRQRSGLGSSTSNSSTAVIAADFRAQLQLKDSQIVLLPDLGSGRSAAYTQRQRMIVIEGGALIEMHRTSDLTMTVWRAVGLGVQAYTLPTHIPRAPSASTFSARGAGGMGRAEAVPSGSLEREGYNGQAALQLLEPFDVRVEEFHKELSSELSTRGLRMDLSPVELILSDADGMTMSTVAQGLNHSIAVYKMHRLRPRRPVTPKSPFPNKHSSSGKEGGNGKDAISEVADSHHEDADEDIEAEFDVRFGDGPLGIRVEAVYQYPGKPLGWSPEDGQASTAVIGRRKMVLSVRSLSQLGPFVTNPAEEGGVRADDELLMVLPAPAEMDAAPTDAGSEHPHDHDYPRAPQASMGEPSAGADRAGERVWVRDFLARVETEVAAEMQEEENSVPRETWGDEWSSKPHVPAPRNSVLKVGLSQVSNMLRLQPRPFFLRFRRRRQILQEPPAGMLSVACSMCTFVNVVDPTAPTEHVAGKGVDGTRQVKTHACEMCGSILELPEGRQPKAHAAKGGTNGSGTKGAPSVKVTRSTVEVRCAYVSVLACLDSDGVESPLLSLNSTDVRGFANAAATKNITDGVSAGGNADVEAALEVVAGVESTAAVQCYDHRAGNWATIAHPWPLRLGYVWGSSGGAGEAGGRSSGGGGEEGKAGTVVIPHAIELEALAELELLVTAPFLRLLGGAGHRLQRRGRQTDDQTTSVLQLKENGQQQQGAKTRQEAKSRQKQTTGKGVGSLQQSPYTLINDTGMPLVYWCDSSWDCEWYEQAVEEEQLPEQAEEEGKRARSRPCRLERHWVEDGKGVGAVDTDRWCGGVFIPPGHKSGFRFRERRGRGFGLARFHTAGEGASAGGGRGGARRVTVQLLTTHAQVAAVLGLDVKEGNGIGGVGTSVDTWRMVQALKAEAEADPASAAAAKTSAIVAARQACAAADVAAGAACAVYQGGALLVSNEFGDSRDALVRLSGCGCQWQYKALRGIGVESVGARSMSTALMGQQGVGSAGSRVAFGMPSTLRMVSEVSVCDGVAPTVLRVRSAIQIHNDTQHRMMVLCNHPAWPQPAFAGEVAANASFTVPLLLGDASEMRVRPAVAVAVPEKTESGENIKQGECKEAKADEQGRESKENEEGMGEAAVRALEPTVLEFVSVTHVSATIARVYVHEAFNTHVDGATGLLPRALDEFYSHTGRSPAPKLSVDVSASATSGSGIRKDKMEESSTCTAGVGWSGWRLQHQQSLPLGHMKDGIRTKAISNHGWSPPFPILLGGSTGEPRVAPSSGGGARGSIGESSAGGLSAGSATATTTIGGPSATKTHQLACMRSNGGPQTQAIRTPAQDAAAAKMTAHREALDRAQEYAIKREQRYDRRSFSPKHPSLSHPLARSSSSPAGATVDVKLKQVNPFTDEPSGAKAGSIKAAASAPIAAQALTHLEQQRARQLMAPSFFIEATASFATANLGTVTTAVIVSVGLRPPLTLCNALPRPTHFCLGNWSGAEHLVGEPAPGHLLPSLFTLASASPSSPSSPAAPAPTSSPTPSGGSGHSTSTPVGAHTRSLGGNSAGRHLMTGTLLGGESCALHNIDLRVCAVLWVALGGDGAIDSGIAAVNGGGWGPGLAVRAQDAVDVSAGLSSTCVVKEDVATSTTTAMVAWRDSPSWPRPSLYYHSQNRQREVAVAAKVAMAARAEKPNTAGKQVLPPTHSPSHATFDCVLALDHEHAFTRNPTDKERTKETTDILIIH